MNNREAVTKWVLEAVKRDYKDDVALVISHTTLRISPEDDRSISYFVPTTPKGYELARTFILNGEGIDIWAMDWDRLERIANLEEYYITCLADAEILYAGNEADKGRFVALQKKLAENLANRDKMCACALEAFEQAKHIYKAMIFSKGSDVKLGAGYVLDYLAQAVAFINLRYFKKAQTEQLAELQTMETVPAEFATVYMKIIKEHNEEEQKGLCYKLINIVQEFLENKRSIKEYEKPAQEADFQELAHWYAELSYTWLRIRFYAGKQDAVKVYMWGIYLQDELNRVCADFGLKKLELMAAYDAEHLDAFVDMADQLERRIREDIVKGGGVIEEYPDMEAFENGLV